MTALIAIDYRAPAFWAALAERAPDLARRFEDGLALGEIEVTPSEVALMESLPGWADGPSYARHPVRVVEDERPTPGPHRCPHRWVRHEAGYGSLYCALCGAWGAA